MPTASLDARVDRGIEPERRAKQALVVLEGIQRGDDVNVPARKVLLTCDELAIPLDAVGQTLAEIGFAVEEMSTGL